MKLTLRPNPTIKDKRVGTNSHVQCFPTYATQTSYAQTLSVRSPISTPISMLSPYNTNDLWISILSRGIGGVGRWALNKKHGVIGQSKLVVNKRTL